MIIIISKTCYIYLRTIIKNKLTSDIMINKNITQSRIPNILKYLYSFSKQ